MKKALITAVLTALTSIICFAQRGGTRRGYEEVGLANKDEVIESLTIAVPLLVVGFLIAYIFMWSKKNPSKISNTSANIGYFGIIMMVVGLFFLVPLLSWFEFIFVNIMTFGVAMFVVGIIVYLIYSAFTKK
jgi:predicted membrane channel-forming protein YqfA (hemolysin III family)